MSSARTLFVAVAALALTCTHAQQVTTPCPTAVTPQKSKFYPRGNSYFVTNNLLGKGELDIGSAMNTTGNSCNLTVIDLADFLSVTGTTSSFCALTVPSGQEPPYNVKLQPTSTFQPNSLTPFGREVGAGRRHLLQNFSLCGRGASFPNIVSQYGAKQSQKYSNLYYSVNMGASGSAAAGYTIFGIHNFGGPGNCHSDALVLDNFLLFDPRSNGPAGICFSANINAAGGK